MPATFLSWKKLMCGGNTMSMDTYFYEVRGRQLLRFLFLA